MDSCIRERAAPFLLTTKPVFLPLNKPESAFSAHFLRPVLILQQFGRAKAVLGPSGTANPNMPSDLKALGILSKVVQLPFKNMLRDIPEPAHF
jgi:hypothetical protein